MPKSDQLSLFPGMTKAAPARVRPWRKSLADDAWRQKEIDPEKAADCLLDLLRRNREFLKALKLAGVPGEAPELLQFREAEKPIIEGYCLVRAHDIEDVMLPEVARGMLELVDDLAKLRLRILDGLEDEQRNQVLKAELRVRIQDVEIVEETVSAAFAIAQESGRVFELEIPVSEEGTPYLDGMRFLGPRDVEALAKMSMRGWKREQESRSLPRQARLKTLLRGLPTVWLDATWAALELGEPPPRKRREREEKIARTLLDASELRRVVRERLSPKERQILSLLLKKGGETPTPALTRRFGSESDDGWYWKRDPAGLPHGARSLVRPHLRWPGGGGRASSSFDGRS